jgi:hypothetical protein
MIRLLPDLDSLFDGQNIISRPWDTTLDVRITDEYYYRNYENRPGTFHTKKQIFKFLCHNGLNDVITIDIHTKHWPVTAIWDSSLFRSSCLDGTVLTGVDPGGWWDVGCPSSLWQQPLSKSDSVTFTSNVSKYNLNNGYINQAQDTISVFWFTFGDKFILTSGIHLRPEEQNQITVFPNPATDYFSIASMNPYARISSYRIYDLMGHIILQTTDNQNIDISELPNGVYCVVAFNQNEHISIAKLLKVHH